MIIYAAGILQRSCWITYRRWLLNLAVFGGVSWILDRITIASDNYLMLMFSGVIAGAFVVIVFVGVNFAVERENAKYIVNMMGRLLKVFKRRSN